MTVNNDVISQNSETIGNMYLLLSILQNMQSNLILIEEGASGKVITAVNPNLFQLAAQYYGDATQWTTIAEANGLSQAFVTGGFIAIVKIINGGSGYINPTFTFTNELQPATISATIVGGVIDFIVIQSGGLYSANPQITIIDENGSGAILEAYCAVNLTIPSSSVSTGGILVD